jgi:hypothetical protein
MVANAMGFTFRIACPAGLHRRYFWIVINVPAGVLNPPYVAVIG